MLLLNLFYFYNLIVDKLNNWYLIVVNLFIIIACPFVDSCSGSMQYSTVNYIFIEFN